MPEETKQLPTLTVAMWLDLMAKTSTSCGQDNVIMQALLRKSGNYPKAKVVLGQVYLYGTPGTPVSIHTMARQILDQNKTKK